PQRINDRFGPLLAHSGDALVRINPTSVRDELSGIQGSGAKGDVAKTLENKAQDAPMRSRARHDVAEEVGFEPTVPQCGTPVFETGPFNHSGTPPGSGSQ